MKAALTDTKIKAMKIPDSGRVELADAACRGLYLRITPNGVKSWSFRYRSPNTGEARRLTIGTYPTVTLASARARADDHRRAVYQNTDPVDLRRAERLKSRGAITFDQLAERYLVEYAKPKKRSWRNDEGYLKRARAAWGDRRARDLTRTDVGELLKQVGADHPISANRLRSILLRLFGWAVDEEILAESPCVRIKKFDVTSRRTRILSDDEIRILWAQFESKALHRMLGSALRFILTTGQRPGECAGTSLDEFIYLGSDQARWEIPGRRTKTGRDHVVPLGELAQTIVASALAQRSDPNRNSRFVFVSHRNPGNPVDRHSLSRAMQRAIAELQVNDENREVVERLWADRPKPHDLRRTVATRLSELGVPREDRKAVIGHVEDDVMQEHYDRYERLSEKRAALVAWESRLLKIIGVGLGGPSATQKAYRSPVRVAIVAEQKYRERK